jgi:sulfide:quinone oxidoreductase
MKDHNMELRKLTAELSVAGQLTPGDIPAVAASGVKGIVCNRPDGEGGPDQPTFSAIEKAAVEHGITIVHQPVVPTAISDSDAATFGRIVDELPKPALAFCRTGMRSSALWALNQAGKLSVEDIVETASKAGYDLRPLMPRLAK